MEEQDWVGIRYFTKEEIPSWPKMDQRAIWLLDEIREFCGKPIKIHAGFEETGHAQESLHKIVPCTAIDGHIEKMSLFEQYLVLERFPWVGIGLYPHWVNPGFHVDLRRFFDVCAEVVAGEIKTAQMRGARWIRDDKSYDKPVYVGLTLENMRRLAII